MKVKNTFDAQLEHFALQEKDLLIKRKKVMNDKQALLNILLCGRSNKTKYQLIEFEKTKNKEEVKFNHQCRE